MPQAQVNGTTLYYEVYGSGIPLVFVHGPMASHRIFEPQVEYFRQRVSVLVMDLRGNGQSGRLETGIGKIVTTQCEDLKQLLKRLGIPKVTIVGCADGGLLALQFADRYPECVEALVLVDSCIGNGRSAKSGKRNPLWGIYEICSWSCYYLPAELFTRSLRIAYGQWQSAYKILRKELLHKRITESIKQRLALQRINAYSHSQSLRVPVLCVAGRQDEWTLNRMQRTVSLIPHARFEVIDNAILPSHLCQPYRFNRLLLDFLIDNRLVSFG